MMKYSSILFCIFPLFIWSCSSVRVQVDYDDEVNFSEYKTYRWLDIDERKKPKYKNPFLEKRVKSAIEKALSSKGMNLKSQGRADLLIIFHFGSQNKIDVTRYDYNPWRRGGRHAVHVEKYQEGTLIIDLIDSSAKQLVWRGAAMGKIDRNNTRDKVIQQSVEQILAQYPPQ